MRTTAEERQIRNTQINALCSQKEKLESRLEKMYMDRLDGVIEEEEYKRISNRLRGEISDIKQNLDQARAQNEVRIFDNSRVLELAQKAASLYSTQIPEEKRKLLNLVYSNSTWAKRGTDAEFQKTF